MFKHRCKTCGSISLSKQRKQHIMCCGQLAQKIGGAKGVVGNASLNQRYISKGIHTSAEETCHCVNEEGHCYC